METKISWDEITATRKEIIQKKAEIESISDRVIQLERELERGRIHDDQFHDDLHKARMKLKHTKETLVQLKMDACEHNVSLMKTGVMISFSDG